MAMKHVTARKVVEEVIVMIVSFILVSRGRSLVCDESYDFLAAVDREIQIYEPMMAGLSRSLRPSKRSSNGSILLHTVKMSHGQCPVEVSATRQTAGRIWNSERSVSFIFAHKGTVSRDLL